MSNNPFEVYESGAQQTKIVTRFGPGNPFLPSDAIPIGARLGETVPAPKSSPMDEFRVLRNGGTAAVAYDLQEANTTIIQRPDGSGNADVGDAVRGDTAVTFDSNNAGLTVDQFVGGTLILQDSTLVPTSYVISGNTATATGATRVTVYLSHGLLYSVDVDTTVQMLASTYNNCQQSNASSAQAAGIPLVAIPANEYYLGVNKGICPVKLNADHTAGADNKAITKDDNGTFAVIGAHGRPQHGEILGNAATANTNYGRVILAYIDLS